MVSAPVQSEMCSPSGHTSSQQSMEGLLHLPYIWGCYLAMSKLAAELYYKLYLVTVR